MRLTTKGRYAVTALLDLAMHSESGPVSLAEIAKRQELSLSYLEQLFVKLRRNKLVASSRGPGGGYSFDRDLATVSVAAIIEAVDEVVDVARRACEIFGPAVGHGHQNGLNAPAARGVDEGFQTA